MQDMITGHNHSHDHSLALETASLIPTQYYEDTTVDSNSGFRLANLHLFGEIWLGMRDSLDSTNQVVQF